MKSISSRAKINKLIKVDSLSQWCTVNFVSMKTFILFFIHLIILIGVVSYYKTSKVVYFFSDEEKNQIDRGILPQKSLNLYQQKLNGIQIASKKN